MVKTRKQQLDEQISETVSAGAYATFDTVDFSDPNRPKTVLEVDFPIIPINHIAEIEGNAGKPIYQMSKWWARRRSSVFRSILLAGAMKAPQDPIDAAKHVWDVYYGNHQGNGLLKHLKVADVFMGGGTTLVEGTRLGMQMYGNDINPVAWLGVKNELSETKINEVRKVADQIEAEVKPQIMPYYTCECPRGHSGQWLKFDTKDVPIKPFFDKPRLFGQPTEQELKQFEDSISSFDGWKNWYLTRGHLFQVMDEDFNPLMLTNDERPFYRYWGPEIIYAFWAKHGPCQTHGCDNRTPIMTSPLVAVKELTVKSWINYACQQCHHHFDVEQQEARMAPGEVFIVSDSEESYTVIDKGGYFQCPKCGLSQSKATLDEGKATNKRISLSLLVHPEWLKGASSSEQTLGGSPQDSVEDTKVWNIVRAKNLKLIEVRGRLPEQITLHDTDVLFNTGETSGSNKGRGKFVCAECGALQQLSTSLSYSGKGAPLSMYAYHCWCPDCEREGELYNGRYFIGAKDVESYNAAMSEWEKRKNTDLKKYWPDSEIVFSHQTHQRDNLPNHGYTHWWNMFNHKQLLILSQLLKAIDQSYGDWNTKEVMLSAFQQYLRYQNMFVFWQMHRDCLAPHFSNNNYHPKPNVVENGVFSKVGSGNWESCVNTLYDGLSWGKKPWEIVSVKTLKTRDEKLAKQLKSKGFKVRTNDPIKTSISLSCGSATELNAIETGEIDLVVTDPPFGDNVQYAELSDFFYVWIQRILHEKYPDMFSTLYTPKALEAVSNRARHPQDPNEFYQRILTESWREVFRILKAGGLLAFTFHHSEDAPWLAVLESLFDAGFYLEATYPIRSDESKGQNAEFGSKKIEYDIIHVCRKRTEEPTSISWARLRRHMLHDIHQLQEVLNNHLESGLTESDLQVIKRGKCLEYFSRHYGKVYVEEGREFTVREALLGINQLLDDEIDGNSDAPPIEAEVLTRQFLRIFNKTTSVQRNEMQNYLRGTGVSVTDFQDKNWCAEENREFLITSPLEFALQWKGRMRKGLSYDLDQTLFMVGACFEGSGITVNDTLSNPNFTLHPAVLPLINWFRKNGGTLEIRQAATKAHQICTAWQARNPEKVSEQLTLFGIDEVK